MSWMWGCGEGLDVERAPEGAEEGRAEKGDSKTRLIFKDTSA